MLKPIYRAAVKVVVISVVTVRVMVRRPRAREGGVTREALLTSAKPPSVALPSVEAGVLKSACNPEGAEPVKVVRTIGIAAVSENVVG